MPDDLPVGSPLPPLEAGWKWSTFTVALDVATYGSEPDDEEIAYLLRMGGIDADTAAALRQRGAPAG